MSYKCIYNGTVLTMNPKRDIIENGVVVIQDKNIVAVGAEDLLVEYDFAERIDANKGIIMPGFINGHGHVSMSVFRSLGDDIPDRLRRYLFPLEDKFVEPQLVKTGARLGIAEMLLSGVTTYADMYYFEDEVASVADSMGIRAIVGETIINRIAPDTENPYGGLEHAVELIKKWKSNDLITPALAPHATYTNDTEHLKYISALAKTYQVPILIHVSEMTHEMTYFKEKYNQTPIEYLESIGFLNDNVIAAHVVYPSEGDMELLATRGVGVVHCVGANAKSGREISPASQMIKKGIAVGLGTDGPMSGNHLDIIGLLDLYTKMQKVKTKDNTVASALEAVEMGTIKGAKALHMDQLIGSLETGKRADIIVIDTQTPNMQPIYDYYSAIVYSAHTQNVALTMVNGRVIVKAQKLLTDSVSDILNEVKQLKEEISEMVEEINQK